MGSADLYNVTPDLVLVCVAHAGDNLLLNVLILFCTVVPSNSVFASFNQNISSLQESLVRCLIKWVNSASDPLATYATGLLASAMEVQDIATNFKDNNAELVSKSLSFF